MWNTPDPLYLRKYHKKRSQRQVKIVQSLQKSPQCSLVFHLATVTINRNAGAVNKPGKGYFRPGYMPPKVRHKNSVTQGSLFSAPV